MLFFPVVCGCLCKEPDLLVLRWGCRLGDGRSYCSCSKWPPMAATQAVKLTQRVNSHLVRRWNLSHIERDVKLENNRPIRPKTVHLVCIINDFINYSVDKMVLVSLNLNGYLMPSSTASVWTLYTVSKLKGATYFFRCNLYKYRRIVIIFRAYLRMKIPKYLV